MSRNIPDWQKKSESLWVLGKILMPAGFLLYKLLCLQYVISCMRNNTTKVNNIKAYLITALYNAPNTMGNYYNSAVNHDLYAKLSIGLNKSKLKPVPRGKRERSVQDFMQELAEIFKLI